MVVVWRLLLFFMNRKPGCHTKANMETSHAYDTTVITTKVKRGDGAREKKKKTVYQVFFCSKSPL
jgi:hypothetical protein